MCKNLLIFIALSFYCAIVNAQSYPSKLEVSKPQFCGEVEGNPRGIKKDQTWQQWCFEQINLGKWKESGVVWDAYSDRDKNVTYSEATEYSSHKSSLSLGDKVYIARIKNGMALVYTSDYVQKYPSIKDPQWKGWIPLENLILWSKCPRTRSSIMMKGLVAHDPKKGDAPEISPRFRLQPTTDASKREDQSAK